MDRLAGSGRNRSVGSSVPSLIGTAVLRSVHSLRCADKRDICKAAGFGIANTAASCSPASAKRGTCDWGVRGHWTAPANEDVADVVAVGCWRPLIQRAAIVAAVWGEFSKPHNCVVMAVEDGSSPGHGAIGDLRSRLPSHR